MGSSLWHVYPKQRMIAGNRLKLLLQFEAFIQDIPGYCCLKS